MSATIAKDSVVSFHYELRNNDGELLDSSDGEPMLYLHGADNIVPGLERAMTDKQVGDKFEVKVPAALGYGEREEGATVVSREQFPLDVELEPGMSVMAEGPGGEMFQLWIAKVEGDEVTIDPNHPLSGVELNFSVEVTEVRAATEEELAHGHPHGPGGHHH